MTDPSSPLLWSVIIPTTGAVTAISVAHTFTIYATAYRAAPIEIITFMDALESSALENESYDSDVAKVQRLEDKVRLGRLLRQIRKCSDDLRDELNKLIIPGDGTEGDSENEYENGSTLRTSARILWANHRKQLENKVRRLDMLRTRFLVSYMGIIAAMANQPVKHAERAVPKEVEKAVHHHQTPVRPIMPKALTDSIKHRPPPRRLSTQSMGHHEKPGTPHPMGWIGVVAELQSSPLMHQRRTSIERSMRSPPPMSPLGSPLALAPQMGNGRFRGSSVESIPEDKI
ncbi:hypothetical protein GGR53DRAFT_330652 [Hypoxylon sp. FL1150]|nr:hypothetical protein GGR53DRAFT_330652 [Hypoxylon sp. FL1150]